jgi:hypothetical protein
MHANDSAAIETGPRGVLFSEERLHTLSAYISKIVHRRLEERVRCGIPCLLFEYILTRIRWTHIAKIVFELPKSLTLSDHAAIKAKIGFGLIRPSAPHTGFSA